MAVIIITFFFQIKSNFKKKKQLLLITSPILYSVRGKTILAVDFSKLLISGLVNDDKNNNFSTQASLELYLVTSEYFF